MKVLSIPVCCQKLMLFPIIEPFLFTQGKFFDYYNAQTNQTLVTEKLVTDSVFGVPVLILSQSLKPS